MLAALDSRELSEWQAFFRLEPWGDERADLRTAQLCCIVANALSGPGDRALELIDFMPYSDPGPKEQPVKTQVALMKSIAGGSKPKDGGQECPPAQGQE